VTDDSFFLEELNRLSEHGSPEQLGVFFADRTGESPEAFAFLECARLERKLEPYFKQETVRIESELGKNGTVVVRTTWQGVHEGKLLGVEPKGRVVIIGTEDIFRLGKGALVHRDASTFGPTVYEQIMGGGAAPAQPVAFAADECIICHRRGRNHRLRPPPPCPNA
jgi:hypothetical protein